MLSLYRLLIWIVNLQRKSQMCLGNDIQVVFNINYPIRRRKRSTPSRRNGRRRRDRRTDRWGGTHAQWCRRVRRTGTGLRGGTSRTRRRYRPYPRRARPAFGSRAGWRPTTAPALSSRSLGPSVAGSTRLLGSWVCCIIRRKHHSHYQNNLCFNGLQFILSLQKKLINSSERRSLKSTASKLIISGDRQLSLNTSY